MGQPATDPPVNPPANPANPAGTTGEPSKQDPPKDTDGKGPAGGKDQILSDLAKERDARQALEKRLAALEPLSKLASALGVQPDKGKTDVETLTATVGQMRDELAAERLERMRLEVAAEKGLTPAQGARLVGKTRDELAADADALKTLFPGGGGQQGGGGTGQPGTPAPDPSQGARGGANELTAALKAAQEKGDTKEAIRLKTLIAHQTNK